MDIAGIVETSVPVAEVEIEAVVVAALEEEAELLVQVLVRVQVNVQVLGQTKERHLKEQLAC